MTQRNFDNQFIGVLIGVLAMLAVIALCLFAYRGGL